MVRFAEPFIHIYNTANAFHFRETYIKIHAITGKNYHRIFTIISISMRVNINYKNLHVLQSFVTLFVKTHENKIMWFL